LHDTVQVAECKVESWMTTPRNTKINTKRNTEETPTAAAAAHLFRLVRRERVHLVQHLHRRLEVHERVELPHRHLVAGLDAQHLLQVGARGVDVAELPVFTQFRSVNCR
jgi:hypothetical protein